jgi:hypothetical protein
LVSRKTSFVRNLHIIVKSSPRARLTRSNTSSSFPIQTSLRSVASRTSFIPGMSTISAVEGWCPIIRS